MVASDLHTQKHKHAYTLTLFPTMLKCVITWTKVKSILLSEKAGSKGQRLQDTIYTRHLEKAKA